MNINIKTTTITMTEAISNYVDKNMDGIKKFLQDDSTIRFDLELAKTTNHHKQGDIFKAEIHIVGKDRDIYTSVEKEDLYVAIDVVKDEVMRKLKSSKDKNQSNHRHAATKVKNFIKGI